MRKLKTITLALVLAATSFYSKAQDWKTEKKINVLFGMNQLLALKGFNIEGNYIHNRLIFDYSHGASLEFSGGLLTNALKSQGIVVHMPWTTGFGVGYRFTEWLNLRVEPKWHRFEFYYEDEQQSKSDQITSYNTISIGLGLYGHWQPFKKQDGFLKGITIAPSVRFWPTVYSTMENDRFTYLNAHTGKNEEIKTLDPGIGFTPVILNVSIGYSFRLSKS